MNRNTVFSAVLLITLAAIIYRLLPPWVEPNFLLRLSKNEVAIEQIHQPRQISATRQVMIDRIELNKGNRFGHPKLGPLGWSENFFADLESRFTVTETGRYRFLVGSDDGFRLSIDGKLLCQFPGDRPFRKQSCYQTLTEGEHTLELHYFQGYGNSGLTLEVARDGEKTPRFWGEKVKGIAYIRPEN